MIADERPHPALGIVCTVQLLVEAGAVFPLRPAPVVEVPHLRFAAAERALRSHPPAAMGAAEEPPESCQKRLLADGDLQRLEPTIAYSRPFYFF